MIMKKGIFLSMSMAIIITSPSLPSAYASEIPQVEATQNQTRLRVRNIARQEFEVPYIDGKTTVGEFNKSAEKILGTPDF